MSDQQTHENSGTSHVSMQKTNPWMISTLILVGVIVGYGLGNMPLFGGDTQASAVVGAEPSLPGVRPSAPEKPQPVVLSDEEYDKLSKSLVDSDDPVLGDKNAPVTIVEFSDFQCPFCQRFYADTFPSIKKNYVDTGKVKVVYKDYPLSFHEQAQKAAEAAQCANEQDKFWEMHDLVFQRGSEWVGDSEKASVAFKQFAQELKLNEKKFASCLDQGQQAAEVRKDFLTGVSAGIEGTPGFFVQGRTVSGAQPYGVFQSLIDEVLAK